jgi:hypothetical protein
MAKQASMSPGSAGQAYAGGALVEKQVPSCSTVDSTQGPTVTPPELHAHVAKLKEELRSVRAELKIHQDAWVSEADKYAALSAKFDREAHDREAVSAKHGHVCKLIRNAESAFYEQCTTQTSFDADGWREMYQKLLRTVMPLFVHRD